MSPSTPGRITSTRSLRPTSIFLASALARRPDASAEAAGRALLAGGSDYTPPLHPRSRAKPMNHPRFPLSWPGPLRTRLALPKVVLRHRRFPDAPVEPQTPLPPDQRLLGH